MQHNVSLPAWSDAPELVKDGVLHVSIHVPAWGATRWWRQRHRSARFQSTLPRGERPSVNTFSASLCMFQSTLPRGERQHIHINSITMYQFQSTLPRGERLFTMMPLWYLIWFQSTLPRGERHRKGHIKNRLREVSIHAPAWGATEYFEDIRK